MNTCTYPCTDNETSQLLKDNHCATSALAHIMTTYLHTCCITTYSYCKTLILSDGQPRTETYQLQLNSKFMAYNHLRLKNHTDVTHDSLLSSYCKEQTTVHLGSAFFSAPSALSAIPLRPSTLNSRSLPQCLARAVTVTLLMPGPDSYQYALM